MIDDELAALAAALKARGWMLAAAESCTGGLIAAACTSLAGSSDWFERGFVTYSDEAKVEMLGVPTALIAAHGAVSAEVAAAMAEGAISYSRGDFAVSVTGIAGPGGGTEAKPVGLVYLHVAGPGGEAERRMQWGGTRPDIRLRATVAALHLLRDHLVTGS